MRTDYEKLFRNLQNIEPPLHLYGDIIGRVTHAKRRAARIRFALFGGTAFAAIIALLPAFQYATAEFGRSGFPQYLSLAFSDGRSVLASWPEFSLSLAESIPLLGITLILSALFVGLVSLKLAVQQTKTAFLRSRFI